MVLSGAVMDFSFSLNRGSPLAGTACQSRIEDWLMILGLSHRKVTFAGASMNLRASESCRSYEGSTSHGGGGTVSAMTCASFSLEMVPTDSACGAWSNSSVAESRPVDAGGLNTFCPKRGAPITLARLPGRPAAQPATRWSEPQSDAP